MKPHLVRRAGRATCVAARFGAAVAMTVALAACTPTPRRVVVVLEDYSGSHAASVVTDATLVADGIIPSMGAADELEVFPIDDAAVQQPTRIVSIDLTKVTLSKLSDGVAHADEAESERRRAFLDTASRTARAAILMSANERSRFAALTDIIGAIQGAARSAKAGTSMTPTRWQRVASVMVGEPLYETKVVIVVASDMLQEARGIDFAHRPPTSARTIMTLIARLQATGAIPDLSGADVIVTGATGESASQVDAVRSFWTQYFLAAHAHLVAYDFDARSAMGTYFRLGGRPLGDHAPGN